MIQQDSPGALQLRVILRQIGAIELNQIAGPHFAPTFIAHAIGIQPTWPREVSTCRYLL